MRMAKPTLRISAFLYEPLKSRRTMNATSKNFLLPLFVIFYCLFFISVADAATLFLSTKAENVAIGDKAAVEVKIDSEDIGFNAAQATVQFPPDIFEVVEANKAGSVFNFWLEEPSFSNADGRVSFIGGSSSGFAGKSLKILEIVFMVKGSGTANLVFTDGAVTASDGSGTNILSALQGIKIASVPKQKIAELTQPIQITRKAVSGVKLPDKPALEIPLYSNPAKWHNLAAPFFVNWKLPPDITEVAAVLNKNPDFGPIRSEGLFESKQFPPLEDGINYLHVRFKNDIGWGPTSHFRLALDTVPPAAFTISVAENLPTDNPRPTLNYQSGDALSGLDRYEIRIDGAEPIITQDSVYTLPLLGPRKHLIRIKAIDKAGNIAENNLELEILPIASPKITAVSQDVFMGEGGLEIKGTAIPGIAVLLTLKDKSGRIAYTMVTGVDDKGNWEAKFNQPLKKGRHRLEAVAQDMRGALSLVTKSEFIKVRERPLLTIAGIGITQFWFFASLILILVAGFAAGWFSYRLWRAQLERKIVIAQRDVVSSFQQLTKDIDKMLMRYADKKIEEYEASEIEFLLRRVRADLTKMQKYIVENIEEISD